MEVRTLGRVDYPTAHTLQERTLQGLIDQRLPETLLLVEHPPVITLGRGTHRENLRETVGIPVIECERGGDVTLHAPGQLVGYVLCDLRRRRDLHAHMRRIEAVLIAALGDSGLTGVRREGFTGVWIGDRKIASIGVACRQWCTWHGFALNVATDLDLFQRINPCGLEAGIMTSMERELDRPVGLEEVGRSVAKHAQELLSDASARVDEPPARRIGLLSSAATGQRRTALPIPTGRLGVSAPIAERLPPFTSEVRMPSLLTDENLEWQAKAREIAEKVVRPLAAKYDAAQEYPWEVKEALAEAGMFKVWIPEAYGGAGKNDLNVLNLCLVVEQLSRACGGVGVLFAVNALGSFPILLGGTEEQKKKYLPQIASGEKLVSFCLSEKFAGSDAGGLAVRAIQEGDGWRIHGEKKWTTNGGAADLYTVFAVTDPSSPAAKRISARSWWRSRATEGFSVGKVEDKMGIRCVPVVETRLRPRVASGRRSRSSGASCRTWGFKHAMMTLDKARPGVASPGGGPGPGCAWTWPSRYAIAAASQFGQSIASLPDDPADARRHVDARSRRRVSLVLHRGPAHRRRPAGDPASNRLAAHVQVLRHRHPPWRSPPRRSRSSAATGT